MTPDDVRAAAEQLVDFHERFASLFGKEQAQDHASSRPELLPDTTTPARTSSPTPTSRGSTRSGGLLGVGVPLGLEPAGQCEMSSRASPRVRGPKIPIDRTTISLDFRDRRTCLIGTQSQK
jgi:hypothetical protein